MTWAGLLARWVELAKGAVALPGTKAGQQLRASVPDIIMLEAVAHALKELGRLDEGERALGVDRAGVLIEKHEGALRGRFRGQLPGQLEELIVEARRALGKYEKFQKKGR